MQITHRIPKFSLIIISLILFWFICKIAIGIGDGKLKAVYIPVGFSILIMLPYIVDKIGTFPFFYGLVFIYWLPFSSGMGHVSPFLLYMYPAEFGMWMLCLGIVIHGSISKSAQFNSAVGRFPFLPFALLIAGSLTANIVSGNLFARSELAQIRILCFLPAVICFLCLYFIKTVKQAERLLWIFLISAGLLGLVYLFAPNFIDPSISDLFAKEDGRLRRIIKLPLFGVFSMSAGVAPACFAFLIALSFNLWLNHPSFRGRLIAAGVLAISVLAIIQGQSRTPLIAATCSVIAIQALSSRFKSYSPRSFLRGLLKPAILIFTLLFSVWYFASVSEISDFRQRGLSLFADPLDAVVSSGRFDLWKTAFAVVLDNPLGVGVYGFPYGVYRASWAAHNLYLFLLLSFGIIGFIGYFWIFLRYTKACWSGLHSNSPNRRLLCIAGMGCVTTLFVAGFGSCIFGPFWAILMGWIPIGITFAVATLPSDDRGQRAEDRGRE